jgi:hypothetical protein
MRLGLFFDTMQVFLSGWTGWIPIVLLIGGLMAWRLLPVRNLPDLAAAEDTPGQGAVESMQHQPAVRRGRFSAG